MRLIYGPMVDLTIEQVNYACEYLMLKYKDMELTIQLPEGYYFETSTKKNVISVKRDVFQVGDYLKDILSGDIFIVNGVDDSFYKARYALRTDKGFRCGHDLYYAKEREIKRVTGEEKKEFDNRLRDVFSIEYNAEKNKFVRCRVDVGKKYFYIGCGMSIKSGPEDGEEFDDVQYYSGNYFISQEAAEKCLKEIKKILKVYE